MTTEPRTEDEALWDQLEWLYAHQGTCTNVETCASCIRWRTIRGYIMRVWRTEKFPKPKTATSTSTGGNG